ncbi:MAG: endonuclease/exonuclease/phosphatase family protein [Candidatus Saccharimonas sp.]
MSRLRVVTWNAEGMFVRGAKTQRATPHDAIKTLKLLEADVVVVPEFGKLEGLETPIRNAIGSLGYQLIEVAYDDSSITERDASAMAVLSRLPVKLVKIHKFGGVRNAVEVHVVVGERVVRVYGLHLDDKVEETRLRQVEDLTASIERDARIPTLAMGDFNAMRRSSGFARLSRSWLARHASERVRHKQLKAIAVRLRQMALGTTIEYLEKHTHLRSLDPGHKLTISGRQAGLEWVPHVRLAKIDWIFGSHQFRVVRYRVFRDVGSDHRPVIADIEI